MTLDEAHLILNAKREESIEQILQVRPLGTGSIAGVSQLVVDHWTGSELRTPVQGKRATGSGTNECARRAGHGDSSAFTLLAVKGCASAGTDRGRAGDSKGGTKGTTGGELETRDEICWQRERGRLRTEGLDRWPGESG